LEREYFARERAKPHYRPVIRCGGQSVGGRFCDHHPRHYHFDATANDVGAAAANDVGAATANDVGANDAATDVIPGAVERGDVG